MLIIDRVPVRPLNTVLLNSLSIRTVTFNEENLYFSVRLQHLSVTPFCYTNTPIRINSSIILPDISINPLPLYHHIYQDTLFR